MNYQFYQCVLTWKHEYECQPVEREYEILPNSKLVAIPNYIPTILHPIALRLQLQPKIHALPPS